MEHLKKFKLTFYNIRDKRDIICYNTFIIKRRKQKDTKKMKVLVACEESQRVCISFREKGHDAYSCDIQECSGGHPEWHIKGDCLNVLNGNGIFNLQNGGECVIEHEWDLIIAHPPCTHLCASGQRWFTERKKPIKLRYMAISFFYNIVMANCARIAIENPVGIMSTCYRKPDQIYNPYDFEGETECKKTCLWLKGLPPLIHTQELQKEKRTNYMFEAKFDGKQYSWNDQETGKFRSKTPWGVARAMAKQWGK